MVDGISASSGPGNGALSGSRTTIAQNFDTFLSILTTQLKNQNPLDPLDTNQFTAQLVQFTGVEQQLKTNEFLESLLSTTQNAGRTDAVGYIGKQVTVSGQTTKLEGSGALWGYNAEANVANANINIKNANGDVVYSTTGSLPAGAGTFAWDGIGTNGMPQPDGMYSISISGTNLSGQTIKVTTSAVGKVTAIDFSSGQPMVTVGNARVPLSDISEVRLPEA
ncbi:flagellar basal-body rod modification protein FlgD [Devosia crocina]|uniref:Basal-body rod modification protein FlgD n=1 Tax=Devosia crocina TaxID=429728 RepID=A0A1I7MYC3_9HYPH|nr:flagellar hook assembly protein FlgD [Devosia crocina]SFV27412.1 flagellar basal-body rod modification protein FlgD [Devosia crocina]